MSITRDADKFYISESAYVNEVVCREEKINEEHLHDFVEIVYILKGKCVHYVDDKEYSLRHGDMLVINYNSKHRHTSENGLKYINFMLKPRYISQSLADSENAFELLNLTEFEEFREVLDKSKCKISFTGEERDRIEGIISVLLDEMKLNSAGRELTVRSLFNVLLLFVFRKMSVQIDNNFNGISDKALNYIKRNCSKKLTLEEMANKCSYNPSYFSRLFKEYTGHTFLEYLKKIRMEKALDLVINSDMPVTEIAYAVGYSEKSKFFKHFKEYSRTTPLQLRKSKK